MPEESIFSAQTGAPNKRIEWTTPARSLLREVLAALAFGSILVKCLSTLLLIYLLITSFSVVSFLCSLKLSLEASRSLKY